MSPGADDDVRVQTTFAPSMSSRNSCSPGVFDRLSAETVDSRSTKKMSKFELPPRGVPKLVQTTFDPEIAGALCVSDDEPVVSWVTDPATSARASDATRHATTR